MNECSFCGNSDRKLIQGQSEDIFICDDCVRVANDFLDGKEINPTKINLTPKEIKKQLDQYVIGQEMAKKILSVGIYNHILKVRNNLDIQKGNILLIGPTGSGKTLLAQTLAKILDVPFVVVDATTLTETGYVGEDVESILQYLLQMCGFDIEKASRGIIYIDEIDKKSKPSHDNPSITRDVSGEGVQRCLLKLIEGTTARVRQAGTRRHPQSDFVELDTTNILFILGGAFVGLHQIVADRLGKNLIGFGEKAKLDNYSESELTKLTEQDDLIRFGMIPELVGRMPILAILDELQIDDLSRILTEPENNLIDQYKKILACDNISVKFPDETIMKIAKMAYDKKIGARGLKSIIENIMLEFMFGVDRGEQREYIIDI